MNRLVEKTKKQNIPKLRFPGFKGFWKENNLGEIGQNIIGLTYSPKNVVTNLKGTIVLRSSNIKEDMLDLRDLVRVDSVIPEKLKIKDGDILICTRNGSQRLIGKNILLKNLPEQMTFGAFMSVYRSDFNYFLTHLFKTEKWNRQIQINLGARINQITTGYLNKFKFFLPSPLEQEKITSFLDSIDEWIENLRNQKQNLEKYKKVIMQQIFSQTIRFKDLDNNNFIDWKVLKLKDCLKESVEKTKSNKEFLVLSSTMRGILPQSEYFKKEIASSDTTGYKILRKNQLVFSPQNLWLGNINICSDFEAGIVSPSYKIFTINTKVVLIDYLNSIIKSKRMLYEYELSSEQGASIVRRSLNMDLFNSIPLKIPSLAEQQKIADFLTSIDSLITFKQEQVIQAENWKKGLMQNLFV